MAEAGWHEHCLYCSPYCPVLGALWPQNGRVFAALEGVKILMRVEAERPRECALTLLALKHSMVKFDLPPKKREPSNGMCKGLHGHLPKTRWTASMLAREGPNWF